MSRVTEHQTDTLVLQDYDVASYDPLPPLPDETKPIEKETETDRTALPKSLRLPGLLVPASESCYGDTDDAPLVAEGTRARVNVAGDTSEPLESEDFEGIKALQLPGLLVAPSDIVHRGNERPAVRNPLPVSEGTAEVPEFEDQPALQLPGLLVSQSAHDSVAASRREGVDDERPARVRGLCATCIHQATCTFPKPLGGVWHCEEYE